MTENNDFGYSETPDPLAGAGTEPDEPYDPPEAVLPPQEVVADPAKPFKAYAGAIVSGIGAFVTFWVADVDPFTAKDAGQAALAALAVAVPGFGLVYQISNPQVVKTP